MLFSREFDIIQKQFFTLATDKIPGDGWCQYGESLHNQTDLYEACQSLKPHGCLKAIVGRLYEGTTIFELSLTFMLNQIPVRGN